MEIGSPILTAKVTFATSLITQHTNRIDSECPAARNISRDQADCEKSNRGCCDVKRISCINSVKLGPDEASEHDVDRNGERDACEHDHAHFPHHHSQDI